jgi:hypothetical protein
LNYQAEPLFAVLPRFFVAQRKYKIGNPRSFCMQYKSVLAGLGLALFLASFPAWAVRPFIVSADGFEVADPLTGLTWRRCAEGMKASASTCIGMATGYSHVDALLHAASEREATGKAWRVPNVKELDSIVDRSRGIPAIDTLAFPATPGIDFWTSSSIAGNTSSVWFVNFNVGFIYFDGSSYNGALRLVRDTK